MSAFMISDNTLSMITNILCRLQVAGYDSFGFESPESLNEVFSNCRDYYGFWTGEKVFSELANMNAAALKARYKDPDDMIGNPKYKKDIDIWEARENGPKQWHYQFLKSLQCYLYQCTEGSIPETALYKALKELENIITYYIVTHTPEYKKAIWD